MLSQFVKLILLFAIGLSFTACNTDLEPARVVAPETQASDAEGDKDSKTPEDKETPTTVQCISERACQMQDAVNKIREDENLKALKFDAVCGFISQEHAEDMFFNSYIDHENLEGQKARQRYEENGSVTMIYENISHGSADIDVITNEWMTNVLHKEALLNDELTHHGIGVWGEGSNTYWVHCMIKP